MMFLTWVVGLMAAGLMGFTFIVAMRYWASYHISVTRGRVRRGLLPLHVWTIALSYDLLLLAVVIQMAVRTRWWHVVLFLPALFLGIIAMAVISRLGKLNSMPAKKREHTDSSSA